MRKMVSLMLLQLFVAILLQVIIAQFTGYMRTAEAQSGRRDRVSV